MGQHLFYDGCGTSKAKWLRTETSLLSILRCSRRSRLWTRAPWTPWMRSRLCCATPSSTTGLPADSVSLCVLWTGRRHSCASLRPTGSEPAYSKLVSALCAEHNIKLLSVENSKELGLWCGLAKLDADGMPRREVACSCCVIKDYGVPSKALDVLNAFLDQQE